MTLLLGGVWNGGITGMLKEIWVEPERYLLEMALLLAVLIGLMVFVLRERRREGA